MSRCMANLLPEKVRQRQSVEDFLLILCSHSAHGGKPGVKQIIIQLRGGEDVPEDMLKTRSFQTRLSEMITTEGTVSMRDPAASYEK